MKSTLTFRQQVTLIKEATRFANTLFRKADRLYLRLEWTQDIWLLMARFFLPIIIAYGTQRIVNMFGDQGVVPYSTFVICVSAFCVYMSIKTFAKAVYEDYNELFKERIGHHMIQKKRRKLARLQPAALLLSDTVNIINNQRFEFYDLKQLAKWKVKIVVSVIGTIAGIALCTVINPWILVATLILAVFAQKIRMHFWRQTENYRDQTIEDERLIENYSAHLTSFGNFLQYMVWGHITYMNRNRNVIRRRLFRGKRDLARKERNTVALLTPLALLMAGGIVLWALYDSYKQENSIFMLGVWFSTFLTLRGNLGELTTFWSDMCDHSNEYKRFTAFMSLPERRRNLPTLRDAQAYSIEFCAVTYTYPGREIPALKGATWKIDQGERVAITGPNGSGKTTSLSLICGLIEPGAGMVRINGDNLKDIDVQSWHQVIACVTQSSSISMTVGELVAGGAVLSGNEQDVWKALAAVGMDEFIRTLKHGLGTRVGTGWSKGSEFSTGQKQKLRLAVALYKVIVGKAKVVVLDEPTANLDVQSKEGFIEALTALSVTLIVSLHDYSLLKHFTRVIEVRDGCIVKDERLDA